MKPRVAGRAGDSRKGGTTEQHSGRNHKRQPEIREAPVPAQKVRQPGGEKPGKNVRGSGRDLTFAKRKQASLKRAGEHLNESTDRAGRPVFERLVGALLSEPGGHRARGGVPTERSDGGEEERGTSEKAVHESRLAKAERGPTRACKNLGSVAWRHCAILDSAHNLLRRPFAHASRSRRLSVAPRSFSP